MTGFLDDLRQAWRSLRSAPGFALAAVLTLSLGIGLNAAILSGVYGVLLRPLGLPHADRLYTVWQNMERRGGEALDYTGLAVFTDWRARNHSFAQMALFIHGGLDVESLGESVETARVTHEFFATLGVTPLLGRDFLAEDEQTGGPRVAILSDGLWRRLGGNPAIVGRVLRVSTLPFTVIGVLPPGFHSPLSGDAELYHIMQFAQPLKDRPYSYAKVIGRLKPGVSEAAARADMNRVAASLVADYPEQMHDIGAAIQPLLESVVGKARQTLLLLLGAVSLVLLVACLNVANLTMSRVTGRRVEFALRMALGASRPRMARLFVIESSLLALISAVVGVGWGFAYLALLRTLAPAQTPRLDSIRLDSTVVLAVFVLSMAGALLAGLLPACWTLGRHVLTVLREAGGGAVGRFPLRLRGALVAAEIALSIVLLIGAGSLLRTLAALDRVDPGFRTEGLVLGHLVVVPQPVTDVAQVTSFIDRFEAGLLQRPEIAAAGVVGQVPLVDGRSSMGFSIDGEDQSFERQQKAVFRQITPHAIKALGLRLVAGRSFAAGDTASSLPVILVNESFARRYLEDRPAVGRQIRSVENEGEHGPQRLIVGVIADIRGAALDRAPEPELYIPWAQESGTTLTVIARARGSEAAALSVLQQVARAVRPGQVVQRPETMETALRRGLAPRRFSAALVDSFALVALILATVGIYGVAALAVSQRRRELAVRQALGASPGSLSGLILRWIGSLTVVGLVAGLAGSAASSGLFAGALYGVEPLDRLTLLAVVLLLAAVALAASLVPALRAGRVDAAPLLRSQI